MTVDGGEYYHNIITDAVSWDKPVELQSAAERETDNSDCVWMPSPSEGGWIPAHVLKRTAKGLTVRPVGGGKERELPIKKGAEGAIPLKMGHLADRFMQPDLVLLEALDPPLIAYCLRHRFVREQIYTWVGADQTVLVSLNPFKRLPIYGAEAIAANAAPAPNRMREPHTYAIASAAYRFIRSEGRDASILISGESGAGKTEATKQCLSASLGDENTSNPPGRSPGCSPGCSPGRSPGRSPGWDRGRRVALSPKRPTARPAPHRGLCAPWHAPWQELPGRSGGLCFGRGAAHPAREPDFGGVWERQDPSQ